MRMERRCAVLTTTTAPARVRISTRLSIGVAADLMPGTYYLRAMGFGPGTTGDYVLTARIITPTCGNGLVESLHGEQCDDGNTAGGDNCNATCQLPIEGTVSGPTGSDVLRRDRACGRLRPVPGRQGSPVTSSPRHSRPRARTATPTRTPYCGCSTGWVPSSGRTSPTARTTAP